METVARIRAARWADKYPVAALIADALQPSPSLRGWCPTRSSAARC